MRTPRRMPWASKEELSELYEMIFAPSATPFTQQRALSRMSVYLSSPSCPTFIHLLHSLLSADLLPVPSSPSEAQAVRLTCSMALVRFINGLVDPLQTGPYARPISHIAASLHIPPSLIALRHRATHEDLPPLPLLKSAIYQAIDYLHRYSFLPLLAGTSAPYGSLPNHEAGFGQRDQGKSAQLLTRWKRMMKLRLRDGGDIAREEKRLKLDIAQEEVGDMVDALTRVGGLIPLAKKKRPAYESLAPPKASLQIWLPLLTYLHESNPTFTSLLADQLVGAVLTPFTSAAANGGLVQADKNNEEEGDSIRWTLTTWLCYLWRGEKGMPMSLDEEVKMASRKRLMKAVLGGDDIVRRTFQSLSGVDEPLRTALRGLSIVLEDSSDLELGGLEVEGEDIAEKDMEGSLNQLESRMEELEKGTGRNSLHEANDDASSPHTHSFHSVDHSSNVVTGGWRRLDGHKWKPCPIGSWGAI